MKIRVLNWLSFSNDPAPPPPDAPERDPEWCHTHGCHSSQCPN